MTARYPLVINGTTIEEIQSGDTYTLNSGSTLTNPTVTNYTETAYTANTSTAITVSLSNGTVQILTLTGNCTLTMPAAGAGKSFIIILRQDATGSRLATFTNAKYTDGTAPILSTGASQVDVLTFFTVNGGSFWFGTFAMANVS